MHKAEGLIDVIVHDGQIQLVVLGNAFPVFNTGAAPVDPRPASDRLIAVNDDIRFQFFHERLHQILLFHGSEAMASSSEMRFTPFRPLASNALAWIFHHFQDAGGLPGHQQGN